jgi:hypothetical protein
MEDNKKLQHCVSALLAAQTALKLKWYDRDAVIHKALDIINDALAMNKFHCDVCKTTDIDECRCGYARSLLMSLAHEHHFYDID